MNKVTSLFILNILWISFCSSLYAQKNVCIGDSAQSYVVLDPCHLMSYKVIASGVISKKQVLCESKIISGKEYYVTEHVYPDYSKRSYQRSSDEGIYMLEHEDDKEILVIPSAPSVGYSVSSANWTFEITSLNASIETPLCTYNNTLTIRITNKKDSRISYLNYYKNGIGNVAVFNEGKLLYYLVSIE